MTSLAEKGSVAVALLLAAAASGSACAMSPTSTEQLRCVVQGEENLPAELGGGEAICSEIRRAAAPVLQSAAVSPAAVSVSVKVTSAHTLTAGGSVSGRPLQEQHVATSDRPLTSRAVGMLANAVAAELSKVAQQ